MEKNKMSEVNKKVRENGSLLWLLVPVCSLIFLFIQMVLWRAESPPHIRSAENAETQIQDFHRYVITELLLLSGGYLQYLSVTWILGARGRKKNIALALQYLPISRGKVFWSNTRSVFYIQLIWVIFTGMSYFANHRTLIWHDLVWPVCLLLNPVIITWVRERKLFFRTF